MTGAKAELRVALITARRNVTQANRRAEANAIAAILGTVVTSGDTVCAYMPVGSEPGSPAMLDALREAGADVLLPAARIDAAGVPFPLLWGAYQPGALVSASFGLLEPPEPLLPPETISRAAVVIVPALAVDRRGVRLGRGAGFYDRSLPLCAPDARRIAVVRDTELVDELPADAHDIAMTHAVLPGAGVVTFAGPSVLA